MSIVALRRNERGIIDEIKTILVMILLSLVVSLGIMPEVIAEAALTKMSWWRLEPCSEEMPYREKPLWEAFSDKYGVLDDTHFYDDRTKSWVFHAIRIKLVPKDKILVMKFYVSYANFHFNSSLNILLQQNSIFMLSCYTTFGFKKAALIFYTWWIFP